MQLKTKLVLSAMAMTLVMVLVLSALFLGELLRQRIAQTTADNEVLAHEVVLMARQAIQTGLRESPPYDRTDEAFQAAVVDALRRHEPLADTMNAILRYSPTVQDVSVTDAHGLTLVSTDPDTLDQPAAARTSLESVRDRSIWHQRGEMFGRPHVLDIAIPLDRNGRPFVVVHLGVRSSFLRAAYEPWFRKGLWLVLGGALVSMLAAALLANAALRPIRRISEQLEELTQPEQPQMALQPEVLPLPEQMIQPEQPVPPRQEEPPAPLVKTPRKSEDAVIHVTRKISQLGRQMRSTEAEYSALKANLNQMLDRLRDGVVLFTADRRALMVSDAVAHYIDRHNTMLVGRSLEDIFSLDTVLGSAVLQAFLSDAKVAGETVTLEDGRRVEVSVDRIEDGRGQLGRLLTLRDTDSALKLEQELEVSQRLVAIGRLTAGVGHEVKNPINAMVLHLELLRSKLASEGGDRFQGAQRHVDILAGEMQRLDRVVQALADFTRPMELHLGEHDLRQVVSAVVDLSGAEMAENGVRVEILAAPAPVKVRVDDDLVRQALLNLLLNAMQAMPRGGVVQVKIRREGRNAVVEVIDEGEGIPPELLPRIFDLYFTTKPTGSGIGLATTYRILQMHGGALEVRSSTNEHPGSALRGSTFTLRLPLVSPAVGSELHDTARLRVLSMDGIRTDGERRI